MVVTIFSGQTVISITFHLLRITNVGWFPSLQIYKFVYIRNWKSASPLKFVLVLPHPIGVVGIGVTNLEGIIDHLKDASPDVFKFP